MTIHVSTRHQMVAVPFDQAVMNLFPSAVRLTSHVAVHHGPDETRLLRNMGYDVPAPIAHHYDWHGGTPYKIQIKTADLLTTNTRAYVLNDMGCVDGDTEYLSPSGWVRIADYLGGKVAQYHPGTGEIEFVDPTEYVVRPCAEMLRFKTTRGLDQMLSPEHRVLLADGSVVSAEDVEQAYGAKARHRLRFRTTFRISRTSGLPLSDAQIRLQIAVNADGTQTSPRSVTVRILKERKIERLKRLLQDAGVEYRSSVTGDGYHRFRFAPPEPKGFHSGWWSMTQEQACVIADEAVHWDGSLRAAGGQTFTSFTALDADIVQYAWSASGKRASLVSRKNKGGVERVVHARAGDPTVGVYGVGADGKPRENIWREPTIDGRKYCFMVPSTFLLLRRNGCIFATGNTGKTKSALWAYDYLRGNGLAKRALVVAPLSTLRNVWAKEIFKTIPRRNAVVLHGDRKQRSKRLAEMDADIYIINPEGLVVMLDELMKRLDIDTLIIDELAVFRNGTTDRTKAARKLAQRMRHVWGMTGSPTPTAPTDAWAQCSIVTPHTVPGRFTHFRDEVMLRLSQFKWVPKREANERVFEVMQPAVRFMLDDVTELPDLIERVVEVPMGPRQQKVYDGIEKHAYAAIAAQEITAANAGAVLNKLLQISTGYVYNSKHEIFPLDNDARLDALVDIVSSSARKVIIFVPFLHALDAVWKVIEKDMGITAAVVHGGISQTARSRIFNDFQETANPRVIVAHPQCMAHGLTLTAADTIIWFGPTTSLEVFEQANRRIRRIGQKHKQQILMLQSTKAERYIYKKLRDRQVVQNALLDMFKEQ